MGGTGVRGALTGTDRRLRPPAQQALVDIVHQGPLSVRFAGYATVSALRFGSFQSGRT